MVCRSLANENPWGPTNAPDNTSPATTGSFSRPSMRVTITLTVAIIVISSKKCIELLNASLVAILLNKHNQDPNLFPLLG